MSLHPNSARALLAAEVAYSAAAAAAAKAKARRDRLRARYQPLIPDGQEIVAGGVSVLRKGRQGSRSFSLKGYEAAGYRLTPRMREHITRSKGSDSWTVKAV